MDNQAVEKTVESEVIQAQKPPQRFNVQCAHCCGIFHETTNKFNLDTFANGSMFRLKNSLRHRGWESFPEYSSTTYADVVCPSCGMQYCGRNGKVMRLQENGDFDDKLIEEEIRKRKEEEKRIAETPVATPVGNKMKCPYCEKLHAKGWIERHMEKCKDR